MDPKRERQPSWNQQIPRELENPKIKEAKMKYWMDWFKFTSIVSNVTFALAISGFVLMPAKTVISFKCKN